jgi:predicted permease
MQIQSVLMEYRSIRVRFSHPLCFVLYIPCLDPKKAPLLPPGAVSTVARYSFNVLTIPLIFATIASSVTIDSLGSYWSLVVGSVGVLGISFLTSTLLAKLIPIANPCDFEALRIAATFPNIVALPILIFPSLCEYPVVYEAFGHSVLNGDGGDEDRAELFRQCVAQSSTMIFCYFFGWSFLFWLFAHPVLMTAASKNKTQFSIATAGSGKERASHHSEQPSLTTLVTTNDDSQGLSATTQSATPTITPSTADAEEKETVGNDDDASNSQPPNRILTNLCRAIKQTFTSPPFVAMILAFVVGCISPLRDLLFSQGGALRFLGAALETLGQASSPISTMVVAASLVPLHHAAVSVSATADDNKGEEQNSTEDESSLKHHEIDDIQPPVVASNDTVDAERRMVSSTELLEESPVMSDPNFGPVQLRRRSSIHRFGTKLRRSSVRALEKVRRTPIEQRRMLIWFTLSRLIVSPALVVLAIVGLDCSGVLASTGVPDLAKLVLIVNASVPGALIVVLLIKSDPELHETATVVAKMYLPTYLFSIVTIAAWTALGLIVSMPDDEGNSFCTRYV